MEKQVVNEFTVEGRNAVIEAFRSGKPIDKIYILDGCQDGPVMTIKREAKKHDTLIKYVTKERLDQMSETGKHQGVIAYTTEFKYSELEDILSAKPDNRLILILDGIEDPHNLGSIIRSAECAGAHGVVITKRRSASVTAAVVKTSAGAAEHMRIARVVNLANAIDTLKEKGLWIAGADMDGRPMYDVDMKGGFALVIGSEGSGLSKLVKEKCDFLVSVPLKGHIDSLNAAVAGAIIMFEKNRQERGN